MASRNPPSQLPPARYRHNNIRQQEMNFHSTRLGIHLSPDTRQIYLESGSFAGLAIHPDVPAALLHDAINRGQSQASSLPTPLRTVERLKNMRDGLWTHPDPTVRDRQHDIRPRLDGD